MFVRACPLVALLPTLSLLVTASGSSAYATSTLPQSDRRTDRKKAASTSCHTQARFVSARPKQNKIVWLFERVATSESTCPFKSDQFQVWIWQGQYSVLSRAPVYPVSMEEPKIGALVDLDLEFRELRELPERTLYRGWFLAEGDSALRVHAP